uniref:mRNA (guanine-N(7))-methyltransferase n=1 Tax=Gossypium raimondii TaxID=29730 RepID=A0A0D2V2S1_GOSRA|nr:hypothetical protein B456_010G0769001 [Gossypium raimondii]
MQRNGMELKSVIMLELDKLEALLQEKDIQADLVCCLQHLQLRFQTEDKARRLLSNVSFLLKPGGYFFGITPEKVIGKNHCFWICVFSIFFPSGYCCTCFWEVIV